MNEDWAVWGQNTYMVKDKETRGQTKQKESDWKAKAKKEGTETERERRQAER